MRLERTDHRDIFTAQHNGVVFLWEVYQHIATWASFFAIFFRLSPFAIAKSPINLSTLPPDPLVIAKPPPPLMPYVERCSPKSGGILSRVRERRSGGAARGRWCFEIWSSTWQVLSSQHLAKIRLPTKKSLGNEEDFEVFFFARKQSLWMVCGRGILKILRLQALGLGIAGMMGEGYVFTFLFSLFFLQ